MYFYGKLYRLSSVFIALLMVFTSQHHMQSALHCARDRDVKHREYTTYVQKKFKECGIASNITDQRSKFNQIPLSLLVHIAEFVGNTWRPTKTVGLRSRLYSLSVCADGYFAIIDKNRTIRILNPSTLDTVQAWKRKKKLTALTSAPDAVILGGSDGSIDLWNVHTDIVTHLQAGGMQDSISSLLALPPHLLAAGAFSGMFSLFDLRTRTRIKIFHTVSWSYAATVTSQQSIAAGSHNTIQLFNISTGVYSATLRGHEYTVRALKTASATLASGAYDGIIKLWDVDTAQCTRTLRGHHSGVYALASLDGNTLISGDNSGMIKFWDVTSGTCTKTLRAQKSTIRSLVPIARNTFASCSYGGSVDIWKKDLMDCNFVKKHSLNTASRSQHKRKFYETLPLRNN